MEQKKSPKGKKRQAKQIEDHLWECSACTYRNNPEAFKCSMCSIRKGTSTRKPKLNPDMVEVQVQKHAFMPPSPLIRFPREEQPRPSSSASNEANQSFEDVEEAGPSSKPKKMKTPAKPRTPKAPGASGAGRGKLKNIDRKNGTVHAITVDNVTISITEYKLKPKKEKKNGEEPTSSHIPSDPESDSQNTAVDQDTRSS
ncbi:RING1 and YY1-binding protein isoform X2 [Eurytemora carolleeae]|uniref:RING1 and YY1-binding protein isoform X2 n=1 Tax=Eurytemora carolleeae TaxID=1294199 RepID=UPI000C75E4D4|nr:RING1 and YY1-binding protein isoform X2 [Eurytemora carolleeae]|eukprot:XP_023337004.1 RING1 and YY1-binding protein-like isoform X2 [Eurytemora affinis]